MCFTSMFVEFIIFIPADTTVYMWMVVLSTFYLVIL